MRGSEHRHFRCRHCGYTILGLYGGQWNEEFPFPPCVNCGVAFGRVDVLDARVRNGILITPKIDARWSSSRYGPGTEPMLFEDPKDGNRSYDPKRDGTWADAIFMCRDCGTTSRGAYQGQWETTFPICKAKTCGDGGQVDCVLWRGDPADCPLQRQWVSSRFGPGTERLRRELTLEEAQSLSRHRSRSPERRDHYPSYRDRSPKQETSSSHQSGHGYGGTLLTGMPINMSGYAQRSPSLAQSSLVFAQPPPAVASQPPVFAPPTAPRAFFETRSRQSHHQASNASQQNQNTGPRNGIRPRSRKSRGQNQLQQAGPNSSSGPRRSDADRKPNPPRGRSNTQPVAIVDVDAYCLSCHHRGHHYQSCTGQSAPRNGPRLSTAVTNEVSVSVSLPTSARELLTIVSLVETDNLVWDRFVGKRDQLLKELHGEMIEATGVDDQKWYSFMSAVCLMVDQVKTMYGSSPRGAMQEALVNSSQKTGEESAMNFATRVFKDGGDFAISKEVAEHVKVSVLKMQRKFEDALQDMVAQMEEYLESCPDILNMDPEDACWTRGAYLALVLLQPSFPRNELYLAPFSYPDMDVIAGELGIWTKAAPEDKGKGVEGTATDQSFDPSPTDSGKAPAENNATDNVGRDSPLATPSIDASQGGAEVDDIALVVDIDESVIEQ